ncbi:nucleotide exchange factor GrpE [bacterium]|nr:nucleotide exchange factor GrpE [bacterium]
MNTPPKIQRIDSPSPETAPTAPPMMLNLLKRRKTQFKLRRRNLTPSTEKPQVRPPEIVEAGQSNSPSDQSDRLRAELARERERLRLSEASAADLASAKLSLEGELFKLEMEVSNQKLRVEEAAKQLEEAKAFVQRSRADMEHQRKRFQKEREELQKTAAEETLRQLFPVLDNFTYAIDLAEQGKQDVESMTKGMAMVNRELLGILGRLGLETIAAVGQPFDPHVHDAVSAGCDPTQADGIVLAVLRPGYTLSGKVLRPAMVSVNKSGGAPPKPAPEEPVSTETAPSDEPVSTDQPQERLSGLTPLERANRMFDTRF